MAKDVSLMNIGYPSRVWDAFGLSLDSVTRCLFRGHALLVPTGDLLMTGAHRYGDMFKLKVNIYSSVLPKHMTQFNMTMIMV